MMRKQMSIRLKITICFIILLLITIVIASVNTYFQNRIINKDMRSIQNLSSLKIAHNNIALAEHGLSIRLFSRALRKEQYEIIRKEMLLTTELQKAARDRFSSSNKKVMWDHYYSKWNEWKPEDSVIVSLSQLRDSLINQGEMVEDQDIIKIDGDVILRIVATDQIAKECVGILDTIISSNNRSITENVAYSRSITLIMILSGIFLTILIWFFVNKLIIKRLSILSRKSEEIGSGKDLTARMEVKGDDEINSLANSINCMLETIAKSHETIRLHNEQIKMIMNTVPAGLVALNEKNEILPNYSRMAEIILEKSPLTGIPYLDAIGLSLRGEEDQKKLISFIDLLRMEILSDKELAELNPYITYEFSGQNSKKWLKMRYYLINSDSKGKKDVLVIIEDVTEEKKLADKFSQSQRENLQLKAIAEDPDLFREFLFETQKILDTIQVALPNLRSQDTFMKTITEIFRSVHTIKGVAGSFGLVQLCELSKETENVLSEMRKESAFSEEMNATLSTLIDKLVKEFENVRSCAMKILGDDPVGKGSYFIKIPLEVLKKNIEEIHNMQIDDDLKDRIISKIHVEIMNRLKSLKLVPARKGLSRALKIVPSLINRQGKNINFTFEGEDVMIDCEIASELNNPLIHLIRNAFDHGIEIPETRKLTGKPHVATVKLTVHDANSNIVFTISDDGNGIDIQKIKNVAIKRELLTEEEALKLSNNDFYKFLFLPGFTTATQLTDISGRGVGLDVVQEVVEKKMQGSIMIESVLEKGTTFTLTIPKAG